MSAAQEPMLMIGCTCIYVKAAYLLKGDAMVWDNSKHAHTCEYIQAAYLLKGDAVVWDNSQHARQQVLHLNRDVGWSVVHPLDDLLAQLLYMTEY